MVISKNAIFCHECEKTIQPIVPTFVKITDTQTLTVYAISDYKDPLRSLILRKLSKDLVAILQLGQLMYEKTILKHKTFDLMIPVPLHWTRLAHRGFNQAYEIASVLSKKSNIPICDCIKRIKRTTFQSRLPIEKRAKNVTGVFTLKRRYEKKIKAMITGKHILLVDDLCTTGATLKNVARCLTPYKPASISAVVACRAI